MNKEGKNRFTIPFPKLLSQFIPALHLTPQGLFLKMKKDRLIWDGSFLVRFNLSCDNMYMNQELYDIA